MCHRLASYQSLSQMIQPAGRPGSHRFRPPPTPPPPHPLCPSVPGADLVPSCAPHVSEPLGPAPAAPLRPPQGTAPLYSAGAHLVRPSNFSSYNLSPACGSPYFYRGNSWVCIGANKPGSIPSSGGKCLIAAGRHFSGSSPGRDRSGPHWVELDVKWSYRCNPIFPEI